MGGWHRAQEEKEYMSDDDDVIDKIKDEVGPSHGEVSLTLGGPRFEYTKVRHTLTLVSYTLRRMHEGLSV